MSTSRIGTFLLGRVIKIGTLTSNSFIEALNETTGILSRKYKWIITERFYYKNTEDEYFYGKLAKYAPDGEALVVDEEQKKNINDDVPNLIIASSPFIYIPKYSGICYLNIWNKIDEETFKNRITEIVLNYHQNFFVDLELNDVVDNSKFIEKVKDFKTVQSIECTINRPNPLYGDIWKKLRDYLIRRESEILELREESSKPDGIKTILNAKKMPSPEKIELIDSAIFMAIDGYGQGTLRGNVNGRLVALKTGKNPIQIKINKDVPPDELYKIASEKFEEINRTRGLKH